jgi:hypothetical protein
MAWFKVDDGFFSSRKVTSIPRSRRWSAVGLWTIVGTWCAKELTDGHVPRYQFDELGGNLRDAEALVASGLWIITNDGWQFHDWSEYQPTREEVLKAREKDAERQRVRRTSTRTPNGQSSESRHPGPARPDPTTTNSSNEVSRAGTTGPWCARHPGGTDEPCGGCRTARIAFEATERSQLEAKRDKTPHTRAARRGDGHKCVDDGNGWCKTCVERMP